MSALPQVIRTDQLPVRIGCRYEQRSLEQRSSRDGSYSYRLPPMTYDSERLQRALLLPDPCVQQLVHAGDRWVAIVAYSGCAGLALARVIAEYFS